jgi:hypothetical protein
MIGGGGKFECGGGGGRHKLTVYIYGSFKIKNAAIIGEMVEIRARDSIIMITLT